MLACHRTDCGPGRGLCYKMLKIQPNPVSVNGQPVYDPKMIPITGERSYV